MSPFDADSFLNQSVGGPMSTSVLACQEGEYKAVIDDSEKWLTFMSGTNKNGEPWHKASILFNILDDGARAYLKREKVLVPMQCFLDLTADESALDTGEGKNVSIGRLRAVLDQNADPNWKLADFRGKGPLMVKVTQRSDQKDPSVKYAEVSRVAKLS